MLYQLKFSFLLQSLSIVSLIEGLIIVVLVKHIFSLCIRSKKKEICISLFLIKNYILCAWINIVLVCISPYILTLFTKIRRGLYLSQHWLALLSWGSQKASRLLYWFFNFLFFFRKLFSIPFQYCICQYFSLFICNSLDVSSSIYFIWLSLVAMRSLLFQGIRTADYKKNTCSSSLFTFHFSWDNKLLERTVLIYRKHN